MKTPPLTQQDWSRFVATASVYLAALAHAAIIRTRSWCADSPIARVRLAGKLERAENEIALLREIQRIKDARMSVSAGLVNAGSPPSIMP